MTEQHTEWPTTGPAEDYSDLDSFAGDYKPQKAFRLNHESLTDGAYDFEILSASLDKINGSTVVRLILQWAPNQDVEYVWWCNKQESVNSMAADLCVLGFDADKWGPAFNRPLSVELPKCVAALKGKKFRATKTSRQGTGQYAGKTYHNLNIQTLLKGQPMPALTPPVQQPAPSPNGPPDDNIPFSWLPFLPWVAALGTVGSLLA